MTLEQNLESMKQTNEALVKRLRKCKALLKQTDDLLGIIIPKTLSAWGFKPEDEFIFDMGNLREKIQEVL